jgi:protein-S-isoprenylcysteine O-methyltransferase Ste14
VATNDRGAEQARTSSDLRAGVRRRFVQITVSVLVQATILFLCAGRLDWVMAWVYLGLNVLGVAVNALVLLRINPALIAERARSSAGAKVWDKRLTKLLGLPAFLAVPIVAGLDVRFAWSGSVHCSCHGAGVALWGVGFGLVSWAMASNRFFSTSVRIQTEREHTVATGGPYRFVRHPGYVGVIVLLVAIPLVLGSWWALVPAACAMIVLIVRTVLEDRTLLDELDGYQDYAERVRYRLLPGVW